MQTHTFTQVTELSDSELLARVRGLVRSEREATALLVAHLAELDQRDLHLAEGCSSLFSYCTQVLHLSEHAAYNRIEAARASRRFPVILEELASGSIHLTAVRLLAPHLTSENHRELLDAVRHRSKREVEQVVAAIRPLPAVPTTIRKLPTPRREQCDVPETAIPTELFVHSEGVQQRPEVSDMGSEGPLPPITPSRAVVAPLSPTRYKIQFTASDEDHELLQQARDLLRHQIPNGDVAEIMSLALKLLVKKLRQQKCATVNRRFPASSKESLKEVPPARDRQQPLRAPRRVPASVRRSVWARDAGQCAFRSATGRRCTERGKLEFHHAKPFALGGDATQENIELRCRAHNVYEAEVCFGKYGRQRQLENPMHQQLVPERVQRESAPMASP